MVEYLNLLKESETKYAARYWSWLWLAFFLLNSSWLFSSLALYLMKRPVPLGLQVLFTVTSFLLGLLAAAVFSGKAFAGFKSVRASFPPLLAATLTLAVVVAAVPLAMRAWTCYLAEMIGRGDISNWAAALTFAGLLLVMAVFAMFAGMSACAFLLYGVAARGTGRVAAALVAVCLRRLPVFLLLVLANLMVGAVLLKVLQLIEVFLKELLPYGFFSRYVLEMFLAGGKTALALFLLGSTQLMLAKDGDKLREKIGEQAAGALWFPAGAAVLTAVLTVFNVLPYLDAPGQVVKNIEARIIRADSFRNLGRDGEASAEYRKAQADLLAFQAYLTGIEEIRENGKIEKARDFLTGAEEICPDSPYVPYFRGMLLKLAVPQAETDPEINNLFATAAAKSAGEKTAHVPEARLWTIGGYWAAGDKEKAREALSLAIARGIFSDRFVGLAGAGEKRLAGLRQEISKLENLLKVRELYVLLNRAEYEDESAVLPELLEYAEQNPGPESYYQAALLAERIPYPDYMYEYARKYFTAKSWEKEEEIKAALFTSYMYVKSGHPGEAEQLMAAMHAKYPENAEIAGDYAYTLLENQKPARALAVIKALGVQDVSLLYLQAVAAQQMQDYPGALAALASLCREAERGGAAPDEIRKIDEYLYRFLLEYQELAAWGTVKGQELIAEVKKKQEPVLVYYYVLGLEARQAENYEQSNSYFARLLALNSHLAYPYYLLGVNYNEMAGYLKQDCYRLAEKNFLQFLERRPDVVEGYFCLGMVYKHTGEPAKAERAFRKVIALNPRRDNPLYEPFSMYNHALAEIERIKQKGQE
ncbi:tetratricopeptide repeat protein [Desulforamulus hydrothermalis]|uniref:Uncharacterized protein n=1 Tax=Desulforamulus hydrothermalis Lam5 = DSM 18033 TaxID=1121428 RepID=K8DX06_9FIRM|nr:tetratricopeptide repeat protein [Desulforamulus hydrothermalis]CCO06930.1 membrane hypothetical protein [Desulforamulus hydrothermalis Lam5 = DSM 18033]SHG99271.1 Tetratricopeptide repeat-containing protein [Desulforamulus hydrothermalis Lam5 = DSM 18033]